MRPLFRSLACLAFVVLALQQGQAQPQPPQPLKFFKNYFVTGDYVVRGASLWRKGSQGWATTFIPPLNLPGSRDNVPATADILAAFLYVQTAERAEGSGIEHARFDDNDLGPYTLAGSPDPGSGTFFKRLVNPIDPAPCWPLAITGRNLVTYRADVLRFLPIDPVTKKQDLNKPHTIVVPDMGPLFGDDDEGGRERGDIIGPRAIGASLVVVYRDTTKPFSAIVLYDGAFTKRALARMDQSFVGFYDASTNPIAKMTHIVGDGGPFRSEKVTIGGLPFVNPYTGSLGPRWDNPTFNLPTPSLQVGPYGESMAMTVDRFGLIPDCVSFSAAILLTTVQDTDGDGLLDRWEQTTSTNPLLDPNGGALPNLGDMGADPKHADLFAEIGYLETGGQVIYGDKPKPAHSHLPTLDALTKVGDEFNSKDIHVHFDVGPDPRYQTNPANPYIVPANQARGGKSLSETKACPDPTDDPNNRTKPPVECTGPIPGQYPLYPGTIGWKTGFRFMRDEILGFDHNRKDMFRYILAAHAIGIPQDPCLKKNAQGIELFPPQADPACIARSAANTADFHKPRTYSGIADYPGGDLLLTLGGFDDEQGRPVGTSFMQASTIMHEWGHNFLLTHGGRNPITSERLANCRPQHFSVMNYMYQLHGLQKDDAVARLGYAADATPELPEVGLDDQANQGTGQYRFGFYAPKRSSNVKFLVKAATKHCDGSDLSPTELNDLNAADGLGGMVRLNAVSITGPVDWNADGVFDSAGVVLPPATPSGSQDIDFNGTFETLAGATGEWGLIRLQEIGGRRSVGGYYRDSLNRIAVGPLSLDVGRGDIGRGDIGRGDIGRGDIGRGDIGRGDIGRGDIGRGDIGRGDIGRGDIGRGDIGRGGGDTDVGAVDEPFIEIDEPTARAVTGGAPDPPSGLVACLTTSDVCAPEGGSLPVLLKWDAPHFGKPTAYRIYRFSYTGPFAAPSELPATEFATVLPECDGDVCGPVPPTSFFDFEAPSGTQLAYFVRAVFDDGTTSGISNFATVTTPSPVVLNFEGFPDFTVVTNQYISQGVTFTGATILTAGVSLNPAFPPRSGTAVIFDFDLSFAGLMTATFTSPVTRASGYITGNTVITLTCFDGANNLLGSASTPGANFVTAGTGFPPNLLLQVTSPGIAKCTFNDHGNSYTVDDFTFVR